MAWSWDTASKVSGFLVDITLLLGAVVAIVKFRLFNLLGHRWQSSLQCRHFDLPDGSVAFTADYVVTNTGQRPLHLRGVSLQLLDSRRDGPLLIPDDTRIIARRTIRPTEQGQRGNLQIEAGERTIFTLRCHLETMPDYVFVVCALDPKTTRPYTTFRGFYCRHAPPPNAANAEPTANAR